MRSTAPLAVAVSMSCSRAWLVALRRQARAVPDVHMTIGRIQRHPVKSLPISAPTPASPTPAQARESVDSVEADGECQERPDCVTRNEPGEQGPQPCRRPYRPVCRADRLIRSRARRLMPTPAARMRPAAISPSWCTAPGGIPERDDDDSGRDGDRTDRHAMQPRFLVTARTRGTALAVFPAGPGRGRRSSETHDGRGGAPQGSGPRSVRRSPG